MLAVAPKKVHGFLTFGDEVQRQIYRCDLLEALSDVSDAVSSGRSYASDTQLFRALISSVPSIGNTLILLPQV